MSQDPGPYFYCGPSLLLSQQARGKFQMMLEKSSQVDFQHREKNGIRLKELEPQKRLQMEFDAKKCNYANEDEIGATKKGQM